MGVGQVWLEEMARTLLPERLKVPLRHLRFALRQRSFDPYVTTLDEGGTKFAFYIGDIIGHEWYGSSLPGTISHENAFVRDRMIARGDVAFDCGAHHGRNSVLLAKWVGDEGKVIAFEPSPGNVRIVRRNIELNGLKNLVCEPKAIGSAPGMMRMTDESNSRITAVRDLGVQVEVIALDQYVDQKPTLLKIDVEGFEVEVLKGARAVLAQHPKLILEIHTKTLANFHTSVDELLSLLDRDAYDFWIQWDSSEPPQPYNMRDPITKRVHLFGMPKS